MAFGLWLLKYEIKNKSKIFILRFLRYSSKPVKKAKSRPSILRRLFIPEIIAVIFHESFFSEIILMRKKPIVAEKAQLSVVKR